MRFCRIALLGDSAPRHQFNRPIGRKPIFVASLRVEGDTGISPGEIRFDAFGVPTAWGAGC
jgi:hypothetical protein